MLIFETCFLKKKFFWRHAIWNSPWSTFSSYWRQSYSKRMTVLRRYFIDRLGGPIGKLLVLSEIAKLYDTLEITPHWRYWRIWEKRNHYACWIEVSRNLSLRHAYLIPAYFGAMLIFKKVLIIARVRYLQSTVSSAKFSIVSYDFEKVSAIDESNAWLTNFSLFWWLLCSGYLQKEAAVIPIILPFVHHGFTDFTVHLRILMSVFKWTAKWANPW